MPAKACSQKKKKTLEQNKVGYILRCRKDPLHAVGSRMRPGQELDPLSRCRPAYVFIYADQSAVLPHRWLRLEAGVGVVGVLINLFFFS